MKTTKHEKPFLAIDYDLLGITSVEVNGETHEVKLHHKIVYSYLQSLSGTFKQVTPSLTGIGKRLGLGTDQTVRRHIKDLVSFGWVQIVDEGRRGKTNIYIVLPYAPETQQEAPEDAPAPTMTNVIEETVIVPESGPDEVPDWFNSKGDVKPKPKAPMNKMNAACEILIQNIDHQAETESFTQFIERVYRNNRKIRLPPGIEDYFKNTHPELYNIFDPIPF